VEVIFKGSKTSKHHPFEGNSHTLPRSSSPGEEHRGMASKGHGIDGEKDCEERTTFIGAREVSVERKGHVLPERADLAKLLWEKRVFSHSQ